MRLELDIAEWAPGGDGVAITEIKGERRAVFVSGVAVGERVSVEVDPKPRPARGTQLNVLTPSKDRAVPVCVYVERCGACDWMHLTPAAQATAHAAIVSKLLDFPVTTHAAPKTVGYRTRARVHLEAKKRVVVGMFTRGSHEPAEVDRCVVLEPALDRTRLALATYLEGARGKGEASLALGVDRKAVFDLRWLGELPATTFGRIEQAVKAGEIGGARIFAGDVSVPAVIGDATPFVVGADGKPLRLAPGGFSQASEDGNVLLARHVLQVTNDGDSAVELYAGAGNLTVLLAAGRELIAVESRKDAVAAARLNLEARGLKAKIVEADAAAFALPKATKLLVLDPPREGARAVCTTIAAARTRLQRIVYVSCDPPTLTRDVKILAAAGWKIQSADTFEMFPHTSHVESVVVLQPG